MAAGKDSRVLAGPVRKVLKLINKVCFAYKRGEWNNGRQKDEQALESKQSTGRLAAPPGPEAPPECCPHHVLCFSERLYLRDICKQH